MEAADAASPDEKLSAGTFIGDFRLFLGSSRSLKAVNCLSFCELISIDVVKFQSLMSEAMPELFAVLVLYSAIDHDCPKAMLHCLKEQGISPDMPLLFGEGVLHHCAKVNAAACTKHLIEHLGANAALVPDQGEQTPAQLAAALKHKETFWAMMQCSGSRDSVTSADVLSMESHSLRAKNKQPLATCTEREAQEPYTLARVRELFETCKIHCGVFRASRADGRKGMEDLVSELNSCQSELSVSKQSLLRRVRLVRLRLLVVIEDSVYVLAELQSDAWLKAQDQKLGKLPYRRLQRQETQAEATRKLLEELGISSQLLEKKMVVPVARTSYVETRASMSYPGLETEYTVCESTWKIRAEASQTANEIGLPNGQPFTREFRAQSFQTISRQFFWSALFDFSLQANCAENAQTENLRAHCMEEENEPDSWGINIRGFLRRVSN